MSKSKQRFYEVNYTQVSPDFGDSRSPKQVSPTFYFSWHHASPIAELGEWRARSENFNNTVADYELNLPGAVVGYNRILI